MEKYQNNLQDQFGNAIDGTTVEVRDVTGGALSSIFSDDGVTAKANPFTATTSEFFFYAQNGRYDITISGPVSDTFTDILLYDPVGVGSGDTLETVLTSGNTATVDADFQDGAAVIFTEGAVIANFSMGAADFDTAFTGVDDWQVTGITRFKLSGTNVTVALQEAASAPASEAGFGQFWTLNEAPTLPMYTSDTGVIAIIDPGISDLNVQNGDYTFVIGDKGKTIAKESGGAGETYTIPANASVAYRIGTLIGVDNDGGGTLSLAITTDTLINGDDNTTGTITIGDGGGLVIKKMTATSWKAQGSQMS